MKRRAVFLDRDGTLNEDVGYPAEWGEVKIFPASFEAVKQLNSAGLLVIVVSNQSGVGRGLLSEDGLRTIHEKMRLAFLARQARLDAVYYCPHYNLSPIPRYKRNCGCRKPEPGLALQAADDFGIDLGRSYMIGDKPEDILLGIRISATPVLVLTGSGRETLGVLREQGLKPAHVAEDILAATGWILEREKKQNL